MPPALRDVKVPPKMIAYLKLVTRCKTTTLSYQAPLIMQNSISEEFSHRLGVVQKDGLRY